MQTNMDIKSICYESGFNNFSNFIRFFKKYNYLSPKKFREKMLKKD
jgi:YesN/AraC family two-component response regulator